jgi:signal peptidase I
MCISQVVVVLSGSMEPGFQRGDILFLNMGSAPIRTGEVVVFNVDGRDIPIVHRVLKVHDRDDGHQDILTKVCSVFDSLGHV